MIFIVVYEQHRELDKKPNWKSIERKKPTITEADVACECVVCALLHCIFILPRKPRTNSIYRNLTRSNISYFFCVSSSLYGVVSSFSIVHCTAVVNLHSPLFFKRKNQEKNKKKHTIRAPNISKLFLCVLFIYFF